MTARKIFQALQEVDGAASAMNDAARAGFLEWALSLPQGANPSAEARLALGDIDANAAQDDAAQLFVGYLHAASAPLPTPLRRGGSSARRHPLH